MKHYVNCPYCGGSGERWRWGEPDELAPCDLCAGFGSVPERMAALYHAGQWRLSECDECGIVRVVVDDGCLGLCANCWPIVMEEA